MNFDFFKQIVDYGAPAVAAVFFGWYIIKVSKDHRDDMERVGKNHREERAELRKQLRAQFDKLVELRIEIPTL